MGPEAEGAIPYTGIIRMRPATDALDSEYIRYLLVSQDFQAQAEAMGAGSVMRHFGPSHLRVMTVAVPPIEEQRAIAEVLGALDEKIESNRRLRAISDDLLRLEVEAAVTAGPTEPRHLGELVERVKEQIQPGPGDFNVNYIGLEHMPRGHVFLDEWGSAGPLASAKTRFTLGDVLFGRLRPYFKKVGVAPVDGVCSTDILVLRPREDAYRGLVLAEAASDAAIEYASAASTGTRMPRVSWDYFARWAVELPKGEALMAVGAATRPLIDEAIALVHQEKVLSLLRDALVRELLSGRLRVADAERVAEAVT